MTRYRELHVEFTDGTSRVVAVERDDPQGRRELDRQAWAWAQMPTTYLGRVWVGAPVDRVANDKGRGGYR